MCVGYHLDPNGVSYLKCKNQWGQDWGEDGYFRLEINYDGMPASGPCFAFEYKEDLAQAKIN